MDIGSYRVELIRLDTGLANTDVARIRPAEIGGHLSGRPDKTAAKYFKPGLAWKSGLVWLPIALVVGFATWMLVSGYASNTANSEPVRLATAVTTEPARSPAVVPAQGASTFSPAIMPAETGSADRLRISSQSWRRGGLGSNALVTFTIRNGNRYAVRDIEIACAFARQDGTHVTDRALVIHDTVNRKSRKTFARLHAGFVNINADQAKCLPIAASRV